MRPSWKILVAAAVASLLVSPAFAASDEEVQEQLLQMQQRMSQLEDKLQATEDELGSATERVDEQHKMLEQAGLDQEQSAMSGLSRFLSETEFGGHVAGSWFWNFNRPDTGFGGGANTGTFFAANPFHPDHNAFTVDQVWFSMSNEATAESRAGFEVDIVFGKTADALAGGGGANAGDSNGSAPYLYTANVSWLAPLGPGLEVTFGRFATAVGAETANTTENLNITRGLLYSVMQPINHTGLKIGQKYDNGLEWMVGAANNSGYTPGGGVFGYTPFAFSCTTNGGFFGPTNSGSFTQPWAQNGDCDDTKALLWRAAYSPSDTLSIGINGLYGGDNFLTNGGGTNDDATGLIDLVINWQPTERLTTWINFDYLWLDHPGAVQTFPGSGSLIGGFRKTNGLGIAAAGRVGITDNTGFALRVEYLKLNKLPLPITSAFGGLQPGSLPLAFQSPDDAGIFSLTGTVDHSLTENLLVRAEVRWEKGSLNKGPNQVFYTKNTPGVPLAWLSGGSTAKSDQVLFGVEAIYEF